jgi:hypothetical protein
MFDKRPATEARYDQMIVDVQQAMLVLPKKAAMRRSKRYQSVATQQLYIRREREMQGCPSEDRRAVRLCYAKLILKATKEDWKQHVHVCNQINKVCEAAESQDYHAVWQGIHLIAGGAVKYSSVQPTCHYDKTTGKSAAPFETTEERTAVWNGFATAKFRATPREINERKMPTLPPKSECTDEPEPTDEDLDECFQALRSRKTPGEDSIPKEVLQSSPEVKADLFNIIRMIWREEHVPERMAEGVAVMIFKNKGSSNDTSQYRAIMLLQVTWKVLSSYLLKRVMADVKGYLPKAQTAYQAKKSTDQNIYVLAEAINSVLAVAKECTVSFVDFSAAFDPTSQVFLTEALLCSIVVLLRNNY